MLSNKYNTIHNRLPVRFYQDHMTTSQLITGSTEPEKITVTIAIVPRFGQNSINRSLLLTYSVLFTIIDTIKSHYYKTASEHFKQPFFLVRKPSKLVCKLFK